MRNSDLIKAVCHIAESEGLTGDNTLFSHSVCPDEINHEEGDITDVLHNHFGEIFSLGGLAGIPFSGKTGFGAYAHHVPDGGNIFVLFAPHCAVSEEGKCGYYHREGQAEESTACGAAIGALGAVKDLAYEPMVDVMSYDVQMQYIKNLIWKNKERITTAPNSIAEATYVLYDHIHDYIRHIVDKKYIHHGKIMILGGIQINVEPDDYFEPKCFFVLTQDGEKTRLEDLKAFDNIPETAK